MNVNLKDIARRAGVSIATVSLSLNGSDKVNAQTRRRVEKLAREMGYRPNPYARMLVTQKSRQIGLILPDIENVYYASLAQYIFNDLCTSGYGLSISPSMNSRLTERKIVNEMIENRMDALLLAPVNTPNDNPGYLNMLDEAGIPVLLVTSTYPESGRPYVMCDLYDGMKQMAAALFRQGRRRIALLSGADGVYSLDRRTRGYLDFLEENGLEYRRIYHLEEVRYAQAQQLIRSLDELDADAYMCVNDMMALGVVNALMERGVRVPEDIAVTGYDDVIFAEVSPVPITTVRQDIRALASDAVDKILDMAQGNALQEDRMERLLPCEIVWRRSTK